MKKEIICTVCPRGCAITVEGCDGKVTSIEGNGCKRGLSFAETEFTAPVRLLTSTVRVAGIVRSVEKYGVFVELTPNLAGLAEYVDGVQAGQRASVYIKSILPERMKIKLIIVDAFAEAAAPEPVRYFTDCSHLDRWIYSPESCEKVIETVF